MIDQRAILEGLTSTAAEVTLTANAASTVVTAYACSTTSHITLTPLTANAAAALTTTYISARGKNTFTITHANNAQIDKTFSYAFVTPVGR
jgi:hypothetical protein